ncbi:unnamed protein product [Acanthoscelides obtectus]|uniref:Uncharacterized protein n=1 Tax=Acanthoscelides obtectus TaxID=200917 RepID=A0A9P0Q868_ACAOB|nr:unnamed protein product [Acanthoscelides obtectus]CAK1629811.1 hypothetical protein AOBTE_LOCUS5971 [Acanthoscelides obtectus]
MEFHEEPEETMNIVKMDTSQVHSSLSKNNEAKSKAVTESQLKQDTNLASDETQASKDVTASERPTTKSRSAEETEEEGSKSDNKESDTDVGMSTSDERVATPSKARKLKRFEEHTSSSDTTDSDAVKEVVVTAEVHSPRSKKRTEEPLLKRVTRTNSTSLAQQEVDPKEQPSTSKQSEGKRSSRKTRSVSLAEEPVGSRRNLRSSSVETEGSVSEKKEENRAMPVDEGESTKKGRRRISSVDESTSTGGGRRGKRRTMSVDELPVIAEDVELGKKTTMDRYTSTRRLTRKQANMMRNSSIPEREEMEKLEGEPFDPIDLLDKEPFQGKADSEESKVYQGSSSTASTVSSVRPGKRITRSASAASDTSVAQVLTPKKQGRSKSQPKSPVQPTEGVKTRSRKYSDSNSVASIQSGSPSPPKRTRKKDDTTIPSSTRKTIRSRTSSISSTKSDAHTKRK